MLDWNSIDTVLLDMDGTLLDLAFDNFFWQEHVPRHYAQSRQISEAESLRQLEGQFTEGVGSLDWYSLDYWSDRLQLDLASIKREVRHMVAARPYAIDFLRRLHTSRRDVVLVTNAHRKTLDIKMDHIDITHWFDRVVVSHELEAPKEDRAFWERLQGLHPFEPARTLLIDDTERVLESASHYGIAHLLTVLQPDSRQALRLDSRFPGIHHFDEIMPEA